MIARSFELVGLSTASVAGPRQEDPSPIPADPGLPAELAPDPAPAPPLAAAGSDGPGPIGDAAATTETLGTPDTHEDLSAVGAGTLAAVPFEEDREPVNREFDSLRLPYQHFRPGTSTAGSIIGDRRATDLHDLALVPTILEAAKFQAIRRKYREAQPGRFLLSAADLRSHRRAPVPEQMLILVIDYTQHPTMPLARRRPCAPARDVRRARERLPHSGWGEGRQRPAAGRGGDDADPPRPPAGRGPGPLSRADRRRSPTAWTSRLRTIRHASRHGQSTIRRVRLVVLTDGAGNVPLAASVSGDPPRNVGREGVNDALAVARGFREFPNVEAIVLDPGPRPTPICRRSWPSPWARTGWPPPLLDEGGA